MANGTLTWLGHASFRLDTPDGKRIYVDPFLNGNPDLPRTDATRSASTSSPSRTATATTSATRSRSRRSTAAAVVAIVELSGWLGGQGVDTSKLPGPNKGGTVDVDGVKFTLTNAFHSSSTPDGSYGGEPSGLVVTLEDGTAVYFAGDTCVFGDMELIARIYEPSIAVLPIGDHYTMGPREAAVALELLGAKRCVPCHWGTFPVLTGTPDELREARARPESRSWTSSPEDVDV